MNRNKLWVFGIFLIALILRCFLIGSRGIWYDDAFSILLARQNLSQIISGTAADTMPPLYYFILHFWMLILNEIWWMRVLSLLLSMGGLVVLFLVVKEIGGWQAAGWSTLMAAVSPLQIYHAQEIRMYALLQILQAAYIYFFIRINRASKPPVFFWVGMILAGTLSLYSHNLAIFFFPVPDLILLLQKKWKLLGNLILAQLMMLLFFLPWAFFVPGQLQKIQTAFWTPKPGLLEISRSAAEILGSLYAASPFVQVIFAFSLILFIVMLVIFVRKPNIIGETKLVLFGLIFLVPVELFVASYLIRPVFVTRGFIVSSLFFSGLAGLLISSYSRNTIRYSLAAAVVVVALISLPAQMFHNSFPRSPFDEAVRITSLGQTDDQIILHDNKLSYFPSNIYHPEARQIFLPDEPLSPNDTFAPASQAAMGVHPELSLPAAVEGYSKIDFVVFSRTIDEYSQMGVAVHPVMQWLGQHYTLSGMSEFADLLVYHYIKSK